MSLSDKTTKPNTLQPEAKDSFFKQPGEGFFSRKTNPLPGSSPKPFFNTPVQAKLSVNEPGDAYEKEADAVADKVMRMPAAPVQPSDDDNDDKLQRKAAADEGDRMQIGTVDPAPAGNKREPDEMLAGEIDAAPLRRKPAGMQEEEDRMRIGDTDMAPLQRKEEDDEMLQAKGEGVPDVTSSFEQSLQGTKGSGSPLPDSVKQQMETGIGADFSDVRVHTGSQAAELSSSIQAQAFTHGSDIYFNEGKYSPGTDSGKHLLAHELTHTVQQGAAGVQRQMIQRKTDEEATSESQTLVKIDKGVTLDLDVDGNLYDREVKLQVNIQNSQLKLGFSHVKGTMSKSVLITPYNMTLTPGTWLQMSATDGIHPLVITVWGGAKAAKGQQNANGAKKKWVKYYFAVVPQGKPGMYRLDAGTYPETLAQKYKIDLGVPADYKSASDATLLQQSGDVEKEAGLYRIRYYAGPKNATRVVLNLKKDLENPNSFYYLFSVYNSNGGAQDSPDTNRKMNIPVAFDDLQITPAGSTANSVSYRFMPGQNDGFTVTYEMLPADKNNPDAANAAHGINVYRNDVSAPVPAGSKQAGNRAFTQHDGVWDTTSNVRTQKGFETESAKDAFTKIKQIKIVDNEQQELMNQMSMIVMEAVQAKVATPYLYALWLDLSLGLVDWGTKAQQGDAAATKLLTNKFNKFIQALVKEIGEKGFEISGMDIGLFSTDVEEENKYTNATRKDDITTKLVTLLPGAPPTQLHKQHFERVHELIQQKQFTAALSSLRESYYLWVEDQLINNENSDEQTQNARKSLGYQMSYRRQLRDRFAKETKPLHKVRAAYYPDFGNLTDEKGRPKFVADELYHIPLDLYYQEKEGKWYVYNFTTLRDPGTMNEFERSEDKKPGEQFPPLELFGKISDDENLGTGYLHYELENGKGDMVRVEYEWSTGDYIIAAGLALGMIALALTGVGLLVDGAIVSTSAIGAAAIIATDAAVITTAIGETVKLGEDYADGAPITTERVVKVGVDIATAALPMIRSLKTLSSLAKTTRFGKEVYILATAAENASWITKFDAVANITATTFATKDTIDELRGLSEALSNGKIDEATFFWGVLKKVTMGAINIKFACNDIKTLRESTGMKNLPKEGEEFGLDMFMQITAPHNTEPVTLNSRESMPAHPSKDAPPRHTDTRRREPVAKNDTPPSGPIKNNEPGSIPNDRGNHIDPGTRPLETPLHTIENNKTEGSGTEHDKELVEVNEGPENKTESVNSSGNSNRRQDANSEKEPNQKNNEDKDANHEKENGGKENTNTHEPAGTDVHIPESLAEKLGAEGTRQLKAWLGGKNLQYRTREGQVLTGEAARTKIFEELETSIGERTILESLQDGQGRFSLVLERPGQTHQLVSIHETSTGEFRTTTFEPAYNPGLNPNIPVPASANRLVPDYAGTSYMHPKNQEYIQNHGGQGILIEMKGTRSKDFSEAFKQSGISKADAANYTWHHMDDFRIIDGKPYCTMQLVRSSGHGGRGVEGMAHSGSVAQYKAYYGDQRTTDYK